MEIFDNTCFKTIGNEGICPEGVRPIVDSILALQPSGLVMEAGHFYAGAELEPRTLAGIRIGTLIANDPRLHSVQTILSVLVDDLHSSGDSLEPSLGAIRGAGYCPEVIFNEKQYLIWADRLCALLSLNEKTYSRKGSRTVILKNGNIQLKDENGNPSCALLDSCVYIDKAKRRPGSNCITILPRIYYDQQKKVNAILIESGNIIPVLCVFYDDQYSLSVFQFQYDE